MRLWSILTDSLRPPRDFAREGGILSAPGFSHLLSLGPETDARESLGGLGSQLAWEGLPHCGSHASWWRGRWTLCDSPSFRHIDTLVLPG